ncbi:MAG: anthranilate phosphoribosyltransferase [Oscillospiraceae bacterium]
MIKEAIIKVTNGTDLSYDEAAEVTREIMTGNTTPEQTAAYLTALHIKGETPDEISASAYVMRDCATRVDYGGDILEIVGTGGDGSNSINVSTISAIVSAAAGAKVAKHGNRAASSKCGTADCLEALGVNIATSPEGCVKLLDEVGMCFLFAQKYHSAMKYVGPVRRAIGIPTVFNILGPLTNPAHANLQLLGVYKPELMKPMAQALTKLGVKRGMAVYGNDRLDEISVSDSTKVLEFSNGEYREYEITPEQFGLERHVKSELVGGTPEENAAAARKILSGEKGAGRDAVLLNAGAALHIVKEIPIEEGIKLAAETIDSGAALATLDKYIKVSNEVGA